MTNTDTSQPTEEDARTAFEEATGESVQTMERFASGRTHFVYDVITKSGNNIVLRMAVPEKRDYLAGSVYWYKYLERLEIPLPKLLGFRLEEDRPFPFTLLERLKGRDLSYMYHKLSGTKKQAIVDHIVDIQKRVRTLPKSKGFGPAISYKKPYGFKTYSELLISAVEQSRKEITLHKVFDPNVADAILEAHDGLLPYFNEVEPIAFINDLSTKNVLVHKGKFSGIVDVDTLSFGDPILGIALTHLILVRSGAATDYTEYWCQQEKLSPIQYKAFTFYTAFHCLRFMSHVGPAYNGNTPKEVSAQYIKQLNDILAYLLQHMRAA